MGIIVASCGHYLSPEDTSSEEKTGKRERIGAPGAFVHRAVRRKGKESRRLMFGGCLEFIDILVGGLLTEDSRY